MTSTSTRRAFFEGFRAGFPFILVIAPFALLFGVVATEAGLQVYETLAFSVAVIAGAAQFTAVQLLEEDAPTVVVLASALAVNLRMAMYSASLTPHLGSLQLWKRALAAYCTVDQVYAVGIGRFEAEPEMSVSERFAFYIGAITPIAPVWYGCTIFGAVAGKQIPDSLALDFAVPITFLALVGPMLKTVPHLIAGFVAVLLALLLNGLPYNLGLILSALVAMVAGAQAELWFGAQEADGVGDGE